MEHVGSKKKRRIAVLMGGPSSEHDVSLKSGEHVIASLDREKYEVRRAVVRKNGTWTVSPEELCAMHDVAFIAMHGTYGEDGTVQRILHDARVPYTGSYMLPSALAMNKFLSTRLFRDGGLTTPLSLFIAQNEWHRSPHEIFQRIREYIGFPAIIKPNDQGSSVGVSIVSHEGECAHAFSHVFGLSRAALAQPYIRGREMTCGVLDHGWIGSAYPLLPTEIVPRVSHFFDYRAKYAVDGSNEITPARVHAPLLRELQRTAVRAHTLLGARGFSRTDMILDEKKRIYVLEVNTIPGLTEQSLLPKAAHTSGVLFPALLDHLITNASYA